MIEHPHRARVDTRAVITRLSFLAFLALPSRGRADDGLSPVAAETTRSRQPRESGFYLGAGWAREFQTLKFDQRAQVSSRNVRWEEWGQAISLAIGYNFGPRFRSELALSGSLREAAPDGASVGTGVARFVGYIPLWTHRGWSCHLLAGCNATGAEFHTPGAPDLFYAMLGGDLGAGVLVGLNRHWALQLDYLHSVLNIEQEIVDQKGSGLDTKNVGRRGRAETMRVGLAYDF